MAPAANLPAQRAQMHARHTLREAACPSAEWVPAARCICEESAELRT